MTSPNKQSFIELVKEHLGKDFHLPDYQKTLFEALKNEDLFSHLRMFHRPSNYMIGIDNAKKGTDETVIAVIVDEASLVNWTEVQEKLYKVLGSGQELRIVYLGERHDSLR